MMNKSVAETPEETLKKLDWIVLIDHSGSMGEPSERLKGRTRLDEVAEEVLAVSRVAEKYDDDGITVIGFSSGVAVYDGVKADKVSSLFKEITPRGSTNLDGALAAAVTKAKSSTKETIVLVYTDGAPNDQDAAQKVIEQAGADLGRPRIAFTFIQVGSDPGATKFLHHLDSELKVDVCAVVPAGDAEGLTVPQLVELGRTA